MTPRLTTLAAILLLFGAATSYAQYPCGNCTGHFLVEQSDFPYSEDILLSNVPLTSASGWQTVLTGCATKSNVNYSSNVRTNAQLRAYLEVMSGTPGVRYEVRFTRSDQPGLEYGWFVRQVKSSGFSQGEFFFTALRNVEAGSFAYQFDVRVLDPGQTVTFGARWMSAQGAPSDGVAPGLASRYPADSQNGSGSYTITGTWSADILPTITFTNTEPVDLFPDAYIEITGGTAGDQLSFGFGLDSEPSSRRTSDAAVPTTFPGYSTREGINIADHLENVPAGTHTLRLWAINRNGRPVTVAARALQFASFPKNNGTNHLQLTQYPLPAPYVHPATTVINSGVVPAQSPKGQTGAPYGYWYPVTAEFSMAADPNAPSLNWTGEGFIEILGRSGTWTDTRADMMVETYQYDTILKKYVTTDMMWVPINIPPGRGQIYFFTEAFSWGTGYENKIRVWMRKVVPEAGATFTVGKVYSAVKLVPMTNGQCTYTGF